MAMLQTANPAAFFYYGVCLQVSEPCTERDNPGIFPSVFIFMAAIKLYC